MSAGIFFRYWIAKQGNMAYDDRAEKVPERIERMAKKIYAVKKGRTTGLFDSWEDCKKSVNGFPGAQYKSFTCLQEAENYLGTAGACRNDQEVREAENAGDVCIAYVDGSFDATQKAYSYGCVLLWKGKKFTEKKAFYGQEDADMRNVAGELEGAMAAMRFCEENKIPLLHLYYDYQGIESWATGEWKRNKPGTIRYKAFVDSLQKVKIIFHKVKGHSGVELNEEVDRLAKSALGIL